MKIGLRIPGEARKLPFDQFCGWCRGAGFQSVDVGAVTDEVVDSARRHGLEIGTADLPGTRELCSEEPEKRAAGQETARQAIAAAADRGVTRMFCVFVPENAAAGRQANFENWKQGFPPVAAYAEERGVRLAMEGWPGPAPYYPALGCSPEMWRAMYAAVPTPAFGMNFDPSHLVRIGIDWYRALEEFIDRVVHVHAKDTEINPERLYEHGNLGPSLRKPLPYGESWWRYTIPGDGIVHWPRLVARLEDAGFDGVISVELEDHRFHGSWEKQAEGLERSQRYLATIVRG